MDSNQDKFKIRLGLFVLVGTMIFIFAVFLIGKQKNLFNPVFKLSTTFSNVSGLQVGNNVRFSGINVGTVESISIINDSSVMVEMIIRQEIKQFIKTDCKVKIGSEGLIGDKLLVISQGSPDFPLVKNGQKLESTEPIETDAIMLSLKSTAENAKIISAILIQTLLKINSGNGTLGRLIQDSSIAENFSISMLNLKKTTKSIEGTAINAEAMSLQLTEIVSAINHGNGTLATLIKDSTIAENLGITIVNLKSSAESLDENMNALKENVFLKRYYTKKAKEAEKKAKEAAENAEDNTKELKQGVKDLKKETKDLKKEIKKEGPKEIE